MGAVPSDQLPLVAPLPAAGERSRNFVRQLFTSFWNSLLNSDYLAGTLAMTFMGVVRDCATRFAHIAYLWILRRLWVTVRLEEKDAELVLAWLRERSEVHASAQLALYSQCSVEGEHQRVYEYEPEIQVTTRLRPAAKSGRRQWIWITRRESADRNDRRLPGVTVSFFGRNKDLLEDILEAGREVQRRRREKYLQVVQVYDYGKDHGLNWLHPQDKDRKQPGRSISSVVLPRCPYAGVDQAEALLDDVREFLASEMWYTERGIPYRRGYLLHGVPGGGKSSLVMAVASELMLPIYMLQLSSEQMTDDLLNSLLQYGMHDPPTILLLEDVDLLHSAVLHRRGVSDDKDVAESREEGDEAASVDSNPREPRERERERKRRGGRLTLSGLLNALDGPTATTGRVLFMTTNARDRLDPALLRSGRIDYEVEFMEAQQEQIERLFARFYQDFRTGAAHRNRAPAEARKASVDVEAGAVAKPDAEPAKASGGAASSSSAAAGISASGARRSTAELAKEFAAQVASSGKKFTTADIQRHLMKRKTHPERALEDLHELLAIRSAVLDRRQRPEPAEPSAREAKATAEANGGSSDVERAAVVRPDAEDDPKAKAAAAGNGGSSDGERSASARPLAEADPEEEPAAASKASCGEGPRELDAEAAG